MVKAHIDPLKSWLDELKLYLSTSEVVPEGMDTGTISSFTMYQTFRKIIGPGLSFSLTNLKASRRGMTRRDWLHQCRHLIGT
jgi:hypothetical protein